MSSRRRKRNHDNMNTPNKKNEHWKQAKITPAKSSSTRRLDIGVTEIFKAKRKRKEESKEKDEASKGKPSEEDVEEDEEEKVEDIYQPISIYKTVLYESKLGPDPDDDESWGPSSRKVFFSKPSKVKAYEFITKNFRIPADFDTSLIYGARSGICHEERIVRAYENKLLPLKTKSSLKYDDPESWMMCSECNEMGHFDDECPHAIS